MKNYEVEAIRRFTDGEVGVRREVGDKFVCTEQRYLVLKSKNAVKLLEEVKEEDLVVTEDTVQAVAAAILEEATEQEKTVEEVVEEIIEEASEEKPKNKKASKK